MIRLVPCSIIKSKAFSKNLAIAIPYENAKILTKTFGFCSSLVLLKLRNDLFNFNEIPQEIKVVVKDIEYHPSTIF